MKQIVKFRGKDVDSGEWRNGSLVTYPNGRCEIVVFDDSEILEYEVDVESVGQFTGVLDKNGKEIYEGDVLSVREWKNLAFGMFNHDEMKCLSLDDCKGELLKDIKSLVYWDEGSMLATEQNGCAYYMCSFWHEDTLITQPIFDIEIIGNIHDTPNLLTDGND